MSLFQIIFIVVIVVASGSTQFIISPSKYECRNISLKFGDNDKFRNGLEYCDEDDEDCDGFRIPWQLAITEEDPGRPLYLCYDRVVLYYGKTPDNVSVLVDTDEVDCCDGYMKREKKPKQDQDKDILNIRIRNLR